MFILRCALGCVLLATAATAPFEVDSSQQPAGHPPLSPEEGAVAATNPPSMIWRVDERARTYTLEMSRSRAFDAGVIRVESIDLPLYNHTETLVSGKWYWRYFVVTEKGERSAPSSVRSFRITAESLPLPVPATRELLARMPAHPRIFVTPETLAAFRRQKDGPAREAWEHLRDRVARDREARPPELTLRPLPADPGTERGQVFALRGEKLAVPVGYAVRELNRDAGRVDALSFAYLISGDPSYAVAARRWAAFVAGFRVDAHLEDRAQHDTVVYCYEYGLKRMALAFDRLYDQLPPEERAAILAHIEYHGENAYRWIRERLQLHLNYQNSHGQQCMHALFTTALAVATDSPRAAVWTDYLVRQYVNRIAWGDNDGGYSEGQKYGHKVQFILEALAALKTATGIDLFRKPRWQNTGTFWLYCMSLNYWWNHWGDVYSLLDPSFGSDADTYITGFLAAAQQDRYVKWYSDARVCDPEHLPFWYLSGSGVQPKPPVDIPQARLFPEVGQLAAYDRFYDHRGSRIFFRSSPWGGHSHAHSDQNGFVIHAGGEILAGDAGYYTYSGDTYDRQWSHSTQAHNSVLINGAGQIRGIEGKGRIAAFFNTPEYCLFTGDAGGAYGPPLRRFARTILFVRPDVWVVHDDLTADEPVDYTWVLNTFGKPEIDAAERSMVVPQREQRLLVRHLAPAGLAYTASNERPYPIKDPTKPWSRYTEAFPQPWNIRVRTKEKRGAEGMLALLHAYPAGAGAGVRNVRRVDGSGLGVRFEDGAGSEVVLFGRGETPGALQGEGIRAEGRAASLGRRADGRVRRWLLHGGTRLVAGAETLWESRTACDVAASLDLPSASAQICVNAPAPAAVRLGLPLRPNAIWWAPPNRPEAAQPVPFTWGDGAARLELPDARELVLWIDPRFDPREALPPVELRVEDGAGVTTVALETARADNGDLIAFGELTPREPGSYAITAGAGVELLVQDRWDTDRSVRGRDTLTASLREGVEIFARFAPGVQPRLQATLKESLRGRVVNLLRNGGFEAGLPEYTPRGWTVQHPRGGDLGWPGWSHEAPAEGAACLRFVRPQDAITVRSQPMRLRTGGRYVLRFQAKGTATHAQVTVSGQRGTTARVKITPSAAWTEYHAEFDAYPGYCTVAVDFAEGGAPNQVLWVDAMEMGYRG